MASALTDEMRQFLDEPRFAVLATINPDGSPQQTVMWFQLDGDELVMNTKRGRRKDRNLVRDPRISVCVEDAYRYVSVAGTARLDQDQVRTHADILRIAKRYEGDEGGQAYYDRNFRGAQRASFRLAVDRVVHNGFV